MQRERQGSEEERRVSWESGPDSHTDLQGFSRGSVSPGGKWAALGRAWGVGKNHDSVQPPAPQTLSRTTKNPENMAVVLTRAHSGL